MKRNVIATTCAAVLAAAICIPIGMQATVSPQSAISSDAIAQLSQRVPDIASSSEAVALESAQDVDSDEQASQIEEIAQQEFEPGVVIVGLADDVSVDQFNQRLAALDYIATKSVSEEDLMFGYALLTLADGVSVEDAINRISGEDVVQGAQPDYILYTQDTSDEDAAYAASALQAGSIAEDELYAQAVTVNDPYAKDQWALDAVNARDAWQTVKGQDASKKVTVAVLDSGINKSHPDFSAANIVGQASYLSSSDVALAGPATRDADLADTYGHGTHVAGIIAATTNNSKGIAGMTYNAQIMPVKVIKSDGKTSVSVVARGLQYVADKASTYNVKVANISIGSKNGQWASTDSELFSTALDAAHNKGILVVYAAGNYASSGAYDSYPCDMDNDPASVGVIALKKTGSGNSTTYSRLSSSNYNKSGQSTKELSAPGDNILSTSVSTDELITFYDSTKNYGYKDGTSMAAPYVSAVAALVFTANTSLTASQVRNLLCETAYDFDGGGWTNATGYGLVNAKSAVAEAKTWPKATSLSSASVSVSAQTYTGGALKPAPVVKLSGKTLKAGTDYVATYSNNTNPGTATVVVRGVNGYSGQATGAFTISKASLKSMTLSQTSATYDGKQKSPTVTVYGPKNGSGNQRLVEGVDYTLTKPSGRTSPGTYTYTAVGKGNYASNTVSSRLTISPLSISNTTITLSQSSFAYDGSPKSPAVTVKTGSTTLKAGTDYVTTYSNNTGAGTAYVTVSGIGNCTGSVSKSFTISVDSGPLYRLFQPANGEHHYTLSADERDICTNRWNWVYEGPAWDCPASSSTPVYRLFNSSTGLHHYTTSADERDICVNRWGWTYEGPAWYSYGEDGVPVYRLFHPVTGLHHYTTSAEERDICTSKWGWTYEGVAWYGVPN